MGFQNHNLKSSEQSFTDGHIAGESGGKAMSRIYGNIGFRGLWNGLPVRIAMVRDLNPRRSSWNSADRTFYADWNVDSLPMADLRQLQSLFGLTNNGRSLME